jgi:hypothetical protein
VREEVIDAVRSRADVGHLYPDERELILYVRQLLRTNRVEQGLFDALMKRHDTRWMVEMTALLGLYQYVSAMINACEIAPPTDGQRRARYHNIGAWTLPMNDSAAELCFPPGKLWVKSH